MNKRLTSMSSNWTTPASQWLVRPKICLCNSKARPRYQTDSQQKLSWAKGGRSQGTELDLSIILKQEPRLMQNCKIPDPDPTRIWLLFDMPDLNLAGTRRPNLHRCHSWLINKLTLISKLKLCVLPNVMSSVLGRDTFNTSYLLKMHPSRFSVNIIPVLLTETAWANPLVSS